MSELAQAALISGGIFAAVTLRGYGRRAFDRRAIVLPLLIIAGFGYAYLRNMPFGTTADLVVYLIAAGLGLAFGGAAYVVTGLERDRIDGQVYTITGSAFVAIWGAAVALRLGFVWAVTDWNWARMHFGEFMISHHISFDVIAPFFLIWALVMVVARIVALKVREQNLETPASLTYAAAER